MKDLTQGNIWKNLFWYAIPTIFSYLLSNAYSIVDSAMVGQFVGEVGLASIGCTESYLSFLGQLINGGCFGFSLYYGALISKKRNKESVVALKSNIPVLIGVAFSISLLSIVFYKPIFALLKINNEIQADALTYYVIIFIMRIFSTFNVVSNHIFNISGMPSFSMKRSIITCVINITLNYVFMKIFKWGVFGAGFATALAVLVVFVLNVFTLKKLIKSLSPEKEKFSFDKQSVAKAWKMAIPCMIQQGVMYFSSATVQPVINSLDTSSIASYSISMKLFNLCSLFFYASSHSLASFCTQCYGNGKVNLVKKGFFSSLILGICFAMPMLLFIYLFPHLAGGLFLKDGNQATLLLVVRYVKICFPFILILILNNFYHNFYKGLMVPHFATITTAVYTVSRIAFTYLLTPTMLMNGVYLAFIISWIIEFVICTVIYLSKKWKTPKFKEMEKALKQN